MKGFLFAMLALVACGPQDGVGTSREPILSGTTDTTDTSVVALIIFPVGNAQEFAACSGTVVSPHVVMTAAHCLDPAVIGSAIDHVSIFLGSDFSDPAQQANPANLAAVASYSFDQSFDPTNMSGGHDIGAVVATDALSLTPLPMNRSSLGSGDVGTAVLSVGFGQSDGTNMMSAGPRRSINTTIFGVDDEHIILDDIICEGDSGGPTFITQNNTQVIAGVHSFTTTDNCIGTGDDTRVDVYGTAFVDPIINQADPGFLPSGGCAAAPTTSGDGWLIVAALALLTRRRLRD
jgi:hypothetical protein